MPGTLSPYPMLQLLTANGAPAAGYKLFVYSAGTTTKVATYSDVGLTVPNTNPIILDSAGRTTIFLSESYSYKYVLAPPNDTDPPTSPMWTQDNIAAVPLNLRTLVVPALAGEVITAGWMVYMSDGDGGRVAGSWYRTDSSLSYASSEAQIVGRALESATGVGSPLTVQIGGEMSYGGGIAIGAPVYLSGAAGVSGTPGTNVRLVGFTDTSTSWIATPHSALSASLMGIGYTGGAGGTVTQGVSKSTGVTLNKVTGGITMNGAALADATTVTFTMTNSAVAAVDSVIIQHQGTGTGGAYLVWAHTLLAGSFKVSVRNVSGGSLSEAIGLSFAIIKGSAT